MWWGERCLPKPHAAELHDNAFPPTWWKAEDPSLFACQKICQWPNNKIWNRLEKMREASSQCQNVDPLLAYHKLPSNFWPPFHCWAVCFFLSANIFNGGGRCPILFNINLGAPLGSGTQTASSNLKEALLSPLALCIKLQAMLPNTHLLLKCPNTVHMLGPSN